MRSNTSSSRIGALSRFEPTRFMTAAGSSVLEFFMGIYDPETMAAEVYKAMEVARLEEYEVQTALADALRAPS
jgi:hypothetical protein